MAIKQIILNNISYTLVDQALRLQLAEQYSTSKTYEINSFCIYNNSLWQCTNKNSGSWNANNWQEKRITDIEGNIIYYVDKEVIDEDSRSIINKTIEHYTGEQNIIGNSAFYNCTSLTSVNFPNCTTVSSYAFQGCISLTSVDFPNCTTISYSAFQSCSSLTSVNFPNCTTIGYAAFRECTSLTSVNFPNCTAISDYAFYNCTSLMSLYLLSTSICALYYSTAFFSTPMSLSTYTGSFGSIYVLPSLVESYKTATNWTYYSDRITAYEGD